MKLSVALLVLAMFGLADSATAEVLRIQSGYAFVDAMVNGAGPFRMLVDTGADSCALTPKAARAAGLRFDAKVSVATVAGSATASVSSKNDVTVGGRTRNEVEFAVSALDGIRQLDDRVDGVIGQSFLRQAPYLIDYRGKQMWLGDEADSRSAGLASTVSSRANSMETIVPVSMGPEKSVRRLMLDSGSSDMILECSEMCPKLTHVESFDVQTNQGVGHMRRGVVSAVEVGSAVLTDRSVALREPAGSDCDGLLPANWFAAVYVDSAHNVVRFAAAK